MSGTGRGRRKSFARVPTLEWEVGGIRHLFRVEAICGKPGQGDKQKVKTGIIQDGG